MTHTFVRTFAAALAGAGLIAGSVSAAEKATSEKAASKEVEQAYKNGWSAEKFLDEAEVHGKNGEEIGRVENLLVDEQGQIVALIAQVGGVWDIGDTHVAVPWKDAKFAQGDAKVTIPVTEENVDDYSMFKEPFFTKADVGKTQTVQSDLATGPKIWKATDLIDDYAVLESGAGYGYVNDLIFDDTGKLQLVVVNASEYGRPGYYGYPWYGYRYDGFAWNPGFDRYVVPFNESEVANLDNAFRYDQLQETGAAGAAPKDRPQGATQESEEKSQK